MTVLYNLAYFLLAVFYFPVFILKLRQADDPWLLIRQRFGLLEPGFGRKSADQKLIWVHTVSVGEAMAVQGFVKQLLEGLPGYQLVLTTVTPTGQKVARKLASDRVSVCYFPFDFSFSVRRFLKTLRPEYLLLVETEIWPNLMMEASRAEVPAGILNARLSPRSHRNYTRFQIVFKPLFSALSFVFAQTGEDRKRFVDAGVSEEKARVAGNMKYDNVELSRDAPALSREFRKRWHLSDESPVGIAGSTHPGEEELIGRVYLRLKEKFAGLKWIVAPRHIERAPAIVRGLSKLGLRAVCVSSLRETDAWDVLILDQMGILKDAYALGDVIFMGGSMVHHGGQNPIEAAAFRKAIVYGPYVFNFEEVYRTLSEEGGAVLADDGEQLMFAFERLLSNPSEREKLGENAYHTVSAFRGSTDRHVEWVVEFLQKKNCEV